jgi:hypothetical protein
MRISPNIPKSPDSHGICTPFNGALALEIGRLSEKPLDGLQIRCLVLLPPGKVCLDVEAS